MEITLRIHINPISISVLLHALILALALLLIYQNEKSGSRQGSEPIQIESITKKPAQSSVRKEKQTTRSQSAAPSSRSKAVPDGITLDSLAMRMDYTTPTAKPSDFYQAAPESHFGQAEPADDWDVLNPDPKLARFNQYIYNTVQGWLDRDRYQNRQELSGTVRVRIWFTGDGEFLENETEYEAIDPEFQKIVERALRKSFANPIPRPFLFTNKKFSIERTVVLRKY